MRDDEGSTPLHYGFNNIEIVKMLIPHINGASIRIPNKEGVAVGEKILSTNNTELIQLTIHHMIFLQKQFDDLLSNLAHDKNNSSSLMEKSLLLQTKEQNKVNNSKTEGKGNLDEDATSIEPGKFSIVMAPESWDSYSPTQDLLGDTTVYNSNDGEEYLKYLNL